MWPATQRNTCAASRSAYRALRSPVLVWRTTVGWWKYSLSVLTNAVSSCAAQDMVLLILDVLAVARSRQDTPEPQRSCFFTVRGAQSMIRREPRRASYEVRDETIGPSFSLPRSSARYFASLRHGDECTFVLSCKSVVRRIVLVHQMSSDTSSRLYANSGALKLYLPLGGAGVRLVGSK